MKIIQLRGTNGVGKSTAVRQFLERHNYEVRFVTVYGRKYPYSYCADVNAIACGRYDTRVCGGLDGVIKSSEILLEYISLILKTFRPKTLILDAAMYGTTMMFAENLSRLGKRFGYDYTGVLLNPKYEYAIELISRRNGGKVLKDGRLEGKYFAAQRSTEKLRAAGYDVKIVDTETVPYADMFKIIENEI